MLQFVVVLIRLHGYLFSVFIYSVYGTAFPVSGYRHNAKFGCAIAFFERSSFHLEKLAENYTPHVVTVTLNYTRCQGEFTGL